MFDKAMTAVTSVHRSKIEKHIQWLKQRANKQFCALDNENGLSQSLQDYIDKDDTRFELILFQ